MSAAIGRILGNEALTDAIGLSIIEELRKTPHSSFIDFWSWPTARAEIDDLSLPPSTYEQAMQRKRASEEDAIQYTPTLYDLFHALDFNVARTAIELGHHDAHFGVHRASAIRYGSVAADLTQQSFYWRVASSPAVRQICEVGFNGGHSSALWLSANPTAKLISFDLFDNKTVAFQGRNLEVLKRVFPGRIRAHKGDSLRTVHAAHIAPRCDLVHIDGRHSYENTVLDAYNLMAHAHPTALFLFDDQCDVHDCRGKNAIVASRPTLATCDLVAAGWLAPITASYSGRRQFALYRLGTSEPDRVLHKAHRVLPCARCKISLTEPSFSLRHRNATVSSVILEQEMLRSVQCQHRT